MARSGNKYDSVCSAKLVLLLVLAAVLLLGYSTAAVQSAEKDPKRSNEIKDNTFLDPFALTLISSYISASSDGPNPHANERAHIMVPYRGWKRSPVKPPWPPE